MTEPEEWRQTPPDAEQPLADAPNPEPLLGSAEEDKPEGQNGASAPNGASPEHSRSRAPSAAGELASWRLARMALGGDEPDEIVPSSEAVTFSGDRFSQRYEESNPGESIIKYRVERAKRRNRRI
jgi:hypothetical protein